MVNSLNDYYKELLLASLKEDQNTEEAKNKEEDKPEEKKSPDDTLYVSTVDMKKAINNFKNAPSSTRLEKYEALYDLLSEMLLQLSDEIDLYYGDEERDESDFFEMIYDVLYEEIAENKFAFFEAYLHSKHIYEDGLLVESSDNVLKDLFGADFKEEDLEKMTPEQKKELEDKMKKLSPEDKKSLFKTLGKYWKKAKGSKTISNAILYSMAGVNPALGIVAKLLLNK